MEKWKVLIPRHVGETTKQIAWTSTSRKKLIGIPWQLGLKTRGKLQPETAKGGDSNDWWTSNEASINSCFLVPEK